MKAKLSQIQLVQHRFFGMNRIRKSNFELLRIICMLMIVALHIVKSHIEFLGYSDIISWVARSFCICAVDVFVLISGYFGIRFKINRLVSIDLQTIFYSVSTLLLLVLLGYHELGVLDIHAFIPVLTKRYWFVTCYLVLYILSPFLNRLFESFDREDFGIVLIIGFALFYIWPSFNALILADQLVSDNGYGLINFVYLYLLGRYIGKFGFLTRFSRLSFLSIYFLSCTLLALLQQSISIIAGFEYKSLFAYNTIFVFTSALSLFLFFERVSFSSKIINRLAVNCLAVYLLHQGPNVWETVSDAFRFGRLSGWLYILLILLFPVFLYLFAVLIDTARVALFHRFEEYTSSKVSVIWARFKTPIDK